MAKLMQIQFVSIYNLTVQKYYSSIFSVFDRAMLSVLHKPTCGVTLETVTSSVQGQVHTCCQRKDCWCDIIEPSLFMLLHTAGGRPSCLLTPLVSCLLGAVAPLERLLDFTLFLNSKQKHILHQIQQCSSFIGSVWMIFPDCWDSFLWSIFCSLISFWLISFNRKRDTFLVHKCFPVPRGSLSRGTTDSNTLPASKKFHPVPPVVSLQVLRLPPTGVNMVFHQHCDEEPPPLLLPLVT